jgi:uncharacterized Ntn-hydrolase superfamily protein
MQPVATYSIVAYDPGRQEWGVATQSKFFGVGAVVPWARAGAGAVATQSYANMLYGPEGLALMEQGVPADEALRRLTQADEGRAKRQAGFVDRNGKAAAFTGEGCHPWAGHIMGDGFACQGNILIPGTIEAMAKRFEAARAEGKGELADWLVATLAAAEEAGGDSRGRQSAAVVVVREGGGYGGNNDRYLDIRVDDHADPVGELRRLVGLHHLYFGETEQEALVPLAGVAAELQALLRRAGVYQGEVTGAFDEATRAALWDLVGTENLEERWDGTGDKIDRLVLDYLFEHYPAQV